MNAPTPASMKKMHDEKRATESTQPVKDSQKSSKPSSTQQFPERKSESPRKSGEKVRTGKSTSSIGTSENTDRSPRSSKHQKTDDGQKKPFVRQKHLTQKPLSNHEGLGSLRRSLTKPTSQKGREPHTRRPHNGPSAEEKLLVKLREIVDSHELVDISNGVEKALGVSATKMIKAVASLEKEGYRRHYLQIKAIGSEDRVVIRVLTVGTITFGDLVKRRNEIYTLSSNKENN